MLATTPYEYIVVEKGGAGVAVVTMNWPEKRNSLSHDVMLELTKAFDTIGADRAVKAVILRGVGPAFSAGHDLREMLGRSGDDDRRIFDASVRLFDACVRLMDKVQAIPQPVIAEVAGVAPAAGCPLVAA